MLELPLPSRTAGFIVLTKEALERYLDQSSPLNRVVLYLFAAWYRQRDVVVDFEEAHEP